jgi:hypothetical protein
MAIECLKDGEIICHGDEWHRRYHKSLFSTKDFDAGSPGRQVKMNAINLSQADRVKVIS